MFHFSCCWYFFFFKLNSGEWRGCMAKWTLHNYICVHAYVCIFVSPSLGQPSCFFHSTNTHHQKKRQAEAATKGTPFQRPCQGHRPSPSPSQRLIAAHDHSVARKPLTKEWGWQIKSNGGGSEQKKGLGRHVDAHTDMNTLRNLNTAFKIIDPQTLTYICTRIYE